MPQFKFYGLKDHLDGVMSDGLDDARMDRVVEALSLPGDEGFHRFIGLEPSEFRYPSERSEKYTIIRISAFEGHSVETRKSSVRLLFERLERGLLISVSDVGITVFETPRHNRGIRGAPAGELRPGLRGRGVEAP